MGESDSEDEFGIDSLISPETYSLITSEEDLAEYRRKREIMMSDKSYDGDWRML